LRGTPTLYYGDEIALQQAVILPDQVRDPFEKNVPGIGVGRDGCRTPMQWMALNRPGFRMPNPGCQWPTTFVMKMWTVSARIKDRSIGYIVG
jgi:alpha-glucosidase